MNDREIVRTAFEAYRDAPPVLRGLQAALRPFICPLGRLLRESRPEAVSSMAGADRGC
jgi:hypothetical protein